MYENVVCHNTVQYVTAIFFQCKKVNNGRKEENKLGWNKRREGEKEKGRKKGRQKKVVNLHTKCKYQEMLL